MMAASLLLAAWACAHPLPPAMAPPAVPWVDTADGWRLPVRHYPGPGEPVLLVHGMAANHYNWDYRPEVSLADYLRDEGRDVWVAVLRGDPGSIPPTQGAALGFDFDDYAAVDLPAVVDHVRRATGRERIAVVGHSMGGMLLYTLASRHPEKVAAGVAISSPARFGVQTPLHRVFGRTRPKRGGAGRVPNRAAVRATALLGRTNPALSVLANPENMDPALLRGMSRLAVVDLPRSLSRQVGTWLRAGELVDSEGDPWLAPSPVPLLVIAGSVDRIVPPANATAACTVFPDCRSVVAGRDTGFRADYGHIDIVLGRPSRAEIYPLVGRFLAERSPPGAGPTR